MLETICKDNYLNTVYDKEFGTMYFCTAKIPCTHQAHLGLSISVCDIKQMSDSLIKYFHYERSKKNG